MAGELRRLALAISFLTRIPVGDPIARDGDMGRALSWFPLVGLAIGALLVTVEQLLGTTLSSSARAVLLVGLVAAISGGLHLDGLADTFDGLGGGRGDRERMLAIMKDSHIGAHGVVALVLVLLAKVVLVADVLRHNSAGALLLWPVVGRFVVVPLVAWFPHARNDGTGAGFEDGAGIRSVAIAVASTIGIALLFGQTPWLALAGAIAFAVLFAWWMRVRLGGLTGDVYGAALELSETAFLVVCAISLR